jgi:hypothetical protein
LLGSGTDPFRLFFGPVIGAIMVFGKLMACRPWEMNRTSED